MLDERELANHILDEKGIDGVLLMLNVISKRAMHERNTIQLYDEDIDKWQRIYELANFMINEIFT